jgi:GT2 family glycosyltransferase
MWDTHAEKDAWPAFKYAQTFYDDKPDFMGEDYTFSLRAQALGYPVYVDTTIECGHIKKHTYTSVDFWSQFPPQEIPHRTAAVIPTRGSNLPLLRELLPIVAAQCDLTIVIDNGCGKSARWWLSTQEHAAVMRMDDVGIHEMWNAGANIALQQWQWTDVAFLNDDLRIPDDMMPKLGEALSEHPELVVVCPNYDKRDMLDLEYTGDICANRYDGTGGVAGFCMMVRGEFLWQYRFPEVCKWWYGDNDLLLACGGAGAIVGTTWVEHVDGGGQSAHWSSPEMKAQTDADQSAWLEHLKKQGIHLKLEEAK